MPAKRNGNVITITNEDRQEIFQIVELSSPPLTEQEIAKLEKILTMLVFETDLWTIDENGMWADLKSALGNIEAERVWDWVEGAGGVQEFMLKYAENFSELLNGLDISETITKPAINKTIEHFKENGFPTDIDVERAKRAPPPGYQPGGKEGFISEGQIAFDKASFKLASKPRVPLTIADKNGNMVLEAELVGDDVEILFKDLEKMMDYTPETWISANMKAANLVAKEEGRSIVVTLIESSFTSKKRKKLEGKVLAATYSFPRRKLEEFLALLGLSLKATAPLITGEKQVKVIPNMPGDLKENLKGIVPKISDLELKMSGAHDREHFVTRICKGICNDRSDEIPECIEALFLVEYSALSVWTERSGKVTMSCFKIEKAVTASFDARENAYIVVCKDYTPMDCKEFLRQAN